jgi:hypothetical protein
MPKLRYHDLRARFVLLVQNTCSSVLGLTQRPVNKIRRQLMSSHLLLYRRDGTIFDLPAASGATFGSTSQMGNWDNNWTHIRAFGSPDQPYFLLYKQSTGQAFTMPIHNAGEFGITTPCGTWETDWAHITPFSAGGKDFVLLYRTSGVAFYLPIHPGPSFGPAVSLGAWENDWAHIEYFNLSGQPFFLLVRQNGAAFAARIGYGISGFGGPGVPRPVSPGVIVDTPVPLGQWETDWAQIRAFAVEGLPYLLFYRKTGEVFTAPVQLSGGPFTPLEERSPAVGETRPGGTWETDWAEIAAFQLADLTFGIDRLDIINQKADSDHADNDWLSLVWTITKAGTKEQIPFSKTIPIPGALRSGESVSGPFSTGAFKLAAGDILTVTALVTNLGSSDSNQQFSQAVQITKKVLDDLIPAVAIVVGTILGAGAGPIGGFQKGKEITDGFDWAIQSLSDLADSLGLHIGPPNCNGVVLSASWVYSSSDLPAAIGVTGCQRVDGSSKSGCGTAPSTNVSWSIRTT